MEAVQELGELVFFAVNPIGRDALPCLIDDFFGEVSDLVEPGAEIVQGADGFIHHLAVIEALKGGFGKVPVGAVESEAVVDHAGDETGTGRGRTVLGAVDEGAVEDALAAVGIGDPFVEDENGAEIVEVGDLGKQGVGQVVVDGDAVGVAGELGAEVPAGLDGDAAGSEVEVELGVGGEELGGDVDEGGFGNGDFEVSEEDGGEQFVNEDAAVLGIVAKLDDIPAAVIRFEQMGLGPASHFSHVPDSRKRHENRVT